MPKASILSSLKMAKRPEGKEYHTPISTHLNRIITRAINLYSLLITSYFYLNIGAQRLCCCPCRNIRRAQGQKSSKVSKAFEDLICQNVNPGCALSEPAANLKRAKKSDSMA